MRKVAMKAVLLLAIVAAALTGCGGSGGGSAGYTIPGMTTATVSGSVAGGTMVAVDADSGAELRRVAASGGGSRPSFSLPVATGKSYRFYLVDNEGTPRQRVYPLYLGSANRFAFSASSPVDFGFIDTSSGVARAGNDVTGVPGVLASAQNAPLPDNLSGSAYLAGDLQGEWEVLQLVLGASPRWVRSSISIGADGSSPAAPFLSSLEGGTAPAASYAITPGGVVTCQGGISGQFSGAMSGNRSLIVATGAQAAGSHALVVLVKRGGSYGAADLQGSWKYHQLVAGSAPRWVRGDAGMDAAGAVTATDLSSGGGGETAAVPWGGTLSISSSGAVTGSSFPACYGVLSADKNLLFALSGDQDGAPGLTVFTRTGLIGFSGADLSHLWRGNWLSATGPLGSSYWGRGQLRFDYPYSYLVSPLQSQGAVQDRAVIPEITAAGVVSFRESDFRAVISPGGDFLVGTATDGAGNYTLYTFLR